MAVKYAFQSDEEEEGLAPKKETNKLELDAITFRKKTRKFKASPVLVVDDEDMNIVVLQGMLKALNYESEAAYTEQKALELF